MLCLCYKRVIHRLRLHHWLTLRYRHGDCSLWRWLFLVECVPWVEISALRVFRRPPFLDRDAIHARTSSRHRCQSARRWLAIFPLPDQLSDRPVQVAIVVLQHFRITSGVLESHFTQRRQLYVKIVLLVAYVGAQNP